MGEALVTGLLDQGWGQPGELLVVEPDQARQEQLRTRFVGVTVAGEAARADAAVLAVKPADVEGACRALAGLGIARVLSIAAGVPLSRLQRWLGDGVAVVRAMPNTPALVGCGAAAMAPGANADADDLAWAESVLRAVGTVERVPEALLDAVTGLSGSGPAYLFLVAEALIDAGVAVGLSRQVSRSLVTQTLLGSARLLAESGEEAQALRAAVTSPGGTTAAGLGVLEARAVRSAMLDAVASATRRSAELGRLED